MLKKFVSSISSSPRELRSFGLTFAVLFALLATWAWYRGFSSWPGLAGVGALFGLCGMVLPTVLMPLQKVWMLFAAGIGWLMSRVILTLLFFLAVTTIGLIGRAVGKRFLELRWRDPQAPTYWVRRAGPPTRESCERQF